MLESSQIIIQFLHQFVQIASQLGRCVLTWLYVFIDRLVQPSADNAFPHTVGNGRHITIILRISNPLCKILPAIFGILSVRHFQALRKGMIFRRFSCDHLSRIAIIILVIIRQLDSAITWACQSSIVNVVADKIVEIVCRCPTLILLSYFIPYWVENMAIHLTLSVGKCSESEKVHSFPIIEGVIMALCTFHTST